MTNKKIPFQTKLITSILWVIFTILLIAIVLWQIYSNNIDFPFYYNNILFIAVLMFFLRCIFFIKYSFIENTIFPKLLIMPLGIFMAIYLYMALNDFIDYYQSNGIYFSVKQFPLEKQYFLGSYIKNEFIFFGVAAFVASAIIPFRMLISVWRVHNRGHE